jgi:hypothetical protein
MKSIALIFAILAIVYIYAAVTLRAGYRKLL